MSWILSLLNLNRGKAKSENAFYDFVVESSSSEKKKAMSTIVRSAALEQKEVLDKYRETVAN